MKHPLVSRRDFVRDTALAAAGAAVGLSGLGASSAFGATSAQPVDTSKILNYNPNMEYRRQGKTGLMVSAVCLGGHSPNNDQERSEVISRCIDVGINYIDACWDNEVKRDAKALKGRRDKMYLALSHGAKEVRNEEYRTARKLIGSLDELLRDSQQEYTDLWRITCMEPGGRHTFDTASEIITALEQAKKAGKARHIGFSTHDRRWIKFMIEYFPQIDVVCFPFTTMSKAAPKDSVFEALKQRDVGAFGIKPFAAGTLFTGNREEDLKKARLALRYILATNTVIPIPGLHTVEQVDNAAKAIQERRELDIKERAELDQLNTRMMASLPDHYQWLKQWECV
ncbi:MAG TPA: aldo/keto reductase [Candidatus Paceibacterota bacterium]|nr:aldo/keto reductase [Verrucomicrobiota bacterium]HRY48972.1 aldo/keto reductase [Candidatus Paceibacterota bacterium]HRZ99749.1 aldo/keto reductase [Candidatus Paceibacterota bacterium]